MKLARAEATATELQKDFAYHERLVKELKARICELEAELERSRGSAQYWKAEHLAGNARIWELEAEAQEWHERYVICCEDSRLVKEGLQNNIDEASARIRELEAEVGEMEADRDSETAWACEYLEAYLFHRDRADRLAVIADALAEELTITHDATIVSEGISIAVNLGGDLKDGESAASWVKRVIKERNRAEAKVKEYDQHIRWVALNLGKALADAAEQKGRAACGEAKLREIRGLIERNSKDLPAEFSRLVDDHFWELV